MSDNSDSCTRIFRTRTGQTISLFKHDCLSGLEEFVKAGSVDVVVTSPPYNIGVRYSKYDDTQPRQDYLDWLERWSERIASVLSPGGSLFLNIGSSPKDPFIPFDVLNVVRKNLVLQNVIHWIKSIYIKDKSYNQDIEINVGHYKPINSKRFLNDVHEYIFHFSLRGDVEIDRLAIGVPYKDASNISRWQKASPGVRCRGNTWYIPYQTIRNRDRERPHPATFPAKLAEMCVKLHGLARVKVVLDPFMGIGHAALGCIDLGVDFIGFEIDDAYFNEVVDLLQKKLSVS